MKNDNKIIKYAVLYLKDNGSKESHIARELGITIKEIKQIIKSQTTTVEAKDKTKPDPIKTKRTQVNSKNLMITETSVKGTKSVAIMTKAASEINDDFRKTVVKNPIISRTSKNAIYHPLPNKKK